MTGGLAKVCPGCGTVSERTWCDDCRPKRAPKASAGARGYDMAWRKLSKRVRRMQPWCSDCGATENLSADHLPSAWERKAKGLPIRVEDVDVVCVPCNAKRGAARGRSVTRGVDPTGARPDPRRQAKFGSHIVDGAS